MAMTGARSTMRPLSLAGVVLVALPALGMAQDAPLTGWGEPNLQGVWDFRTITPLQRPSSASGQEFLSAEEVANLERATIDRRIAQGSKPGYGGGRHRLVPRPPDGGGRTARRIA